MKKDLKRLISVSRKVGRKIPLWTQASGGNISIKIKNNLLIKATGKRLGEVAGAQDLSLLDLRLMKTALKKLSKLKISESKREQIYAEVLHSSRLQVDQFSRPSMEAGFHAVLPKKYVFHFHSLVAILSAHAALDKKLSKKIRAIIPPSLKFRMIDHIKPGFDLCVFLAKQSKSDIYLVRNHGVILQGDSLSILKVWEKIESQLMKVFSLKTLEQISKSSEPQKASLNVLRNLKTSPLKIYFPDIAVSFAEISDYLKSKNTNFNKTQVRSILELLMACALLYTENPKLSELSRSLASAIPRLPTEKIRKREMT